MTLPGLLISDIFLYVIKLLFHVDQSRTNSSSVVNGGGGLTDSKIEALCDWAEVSNDCLKVVTDGTEGLDVCTEVFCNCTEGLNDCSEELNPCPGVLDDLEELYETFVAFVCCGCLTGAESEALCDWAEVLDGRLKVVTDCTEGLDVCNEVWVIVQKI